MPEMTLEKRVRELERNLGQVAAWLKRVEAELKALKRQFSRQIRQKKT